MNHQIIKGIKCYNPELLESYDNFPEYGVSDDIINVDVNFWDRSRYRLFKELIKQETIAFPRVNFLEVGCSNGMLIKSLLDLDRFEITGSEIYLKGLLVAKKFIPNVEFIQLDIATTALEEKRYNLITAFDVLEHIKEDDLAISNIYKMLESGGKFIVSVPQHQFMFSSFDKLVNHQRRYSRKELVAKLQKAGFKVNYRSSLVFLLFPLMVASRIQDFLLPKKLIKSNDSEKFNKKIAISKPLDGIFNFFMLIDEFLIRHRISLPFGGTLLVIAQK